MTDKRVSSKMVDARVRELAERLGRENPVTVRHDPSVVRDLPPRPARRGRYRLPSPDER